MPMKQLWVSMAQRYNDLALAALERGDTEGYDKYRQKAIETRRVALRVNEEDIENGGEDKQDK